MMGDEGSDEDDDGKGIDEDASSSLNEGDSEETRYDHEAGIKNLELSPGAKP
jgi:hypothetical protein